MASQVSEKAAEMEDILSSIRSSLAEQSAKVNTSAGLEVQEMVGDANTDDDDVLELTEAEMVPAENETSNKDGVVAVEDDLIDIQAFASTGEAKTLAVEETMVTPVEAVAVEQVGEQPAPEPVAEKAADEFDRLLAEISSDQKQQVAVAEDQKKALMEDPAFGPVEEILGQVGPKIEQVVEQVVMEEMAPTVPALGGDMPAVEGQGARYQASALTMGDMPQVALPVEVLAMALRPMVEGWLRENLADVVERLVREEIGKLNQG